MALVEGVRSAWKATACTPVSRIAATVASAAAFVPVHEAIRRQAQAEPASLPLSTLLGGRSQPLAAQTGEARLTDMPQQLAEVASEQASERLGGAGQRLALWIILLLGVALLGGMAWSLLRDKGRTPGPPSA